MIRLELDLISGLFSLFWLIVWADEVNKCGWCLAGGRGCWLKGPHQIPSVSWIYHHSLYFHIYQIASFIPGILCPFYCYCKWCRHGLGRGLLIYNMVWDGGQGVGIILQFVLFFFLSFFFTCAFVLCSLMSSVPFLSDYSMIAVVSVSLFFICFLCLWSL